VRGRNRYGIHAEIGARSAFASSPAIFATPVLPGTKTQFLKGA
jgi:hypothetical protein